MSYPLTMPVSMQTSPYVNGRHFEHGITTTVASSPQCSSNGIPTGSSYNYSPSHSSYHHNSQMDSLSSLVFSTSFPVPSLTSMTPVTPNIVPVTPSSQAFFPPALPLSQNDTPAHSHHQRQAPSRKQSVFVAPSGISQLRELHPIPGVIIDPELHHRSVIKSANLNSLEASHSISSSSSSSSSIFSSSNSSSSLSLSSSSSLPQHRHLSSNELITQHISQLILNNEAVITGTVSQLSAASKRSLSISHAQIQNSNALLEPANANNNIITSSQLGHLNFSSSNSYNAHSAYSKLHSALLGENCSGSSSGLPSPPGLSDAVRSRKYSEMPYSQYANIQKALHIQNQHSLHPPVINNKHHAPQMQSINHNTTGESLVRNLLISKVSPFVHLDTSTTSTSSQSNQSSALTAPTDSSIIKDLLLKSRSPELISDQLQPPGSIVSTHKRSRTESLNNNNAVYPCIKCRACFRSAQTLECHQQFYCKGHDLSQMQHQSQGQSDICIQQHSVASSQSHQRRVSVLDRPSIITFRPVSPISSLSTLSTCTANSSSAENLDNIGNILKSTLLSNDSDSFYSSIPLKKRRKISEPAFRHSYSNEFRNRHSKARFSTTELPTFSRIRNKQNQFFEILPAYSPHLNRQPTKITIHGEILFPILQELIDSGTNHEFIVGESTLSSSSSTSLLTTTELFASKVSKLSNQNDKSIESEVGILLNDILSQIPSLVNNSPELEIEQCLEDMICEIEKKSRPNSLTLTLPKTFQQSARNLNESNITSDSLFLNRRSVPEIDNIDNVIDKKTTNRGGLISSNLISPDMPRSQRKYQQLYINGSAYTNIELIVSTRVTFCSIYRPQPMFVTQDANPQLSMYSEWTISKVPSGDILELVGVPSALFSAHDSIEVVLSVERAQHKAQPLGSCETIELAQQQHSSDYNNTLQFKQSSQNVCFAKCEKQSEHELKFHLEQAVIHPELIKSISSEKSVTKQTSTSFIVDKLLHCIRFPIDGKGFADRVLSTSVRSQLLLVHSLSKLKRRLSRVHENMVQANVSGQRKLSINSGTLIGMHSLFGHFPDSSKEMILLKRIMEQIPPNFSIPSRRELSTSCNLVSRKFSECIGIRQSRTLDDNWSTRIGPDGVSELIPKRIRIFEGGFKSNEDYTYVRGRGRGKYVCEECGIRCKKPSMLKKHIRTHTDLRPYSCRHCAFAFKTKGNLTKHMKSKAHHKKCVELGINPVPTTIDDSQIDSHALARQEQYELACSGSDSGNPLSSLKHYDEDESDFEDDDFDEDDEDDDEGVPISTLDQAARLTYIVPGQTNENLNHMPKTSRSRKSSHRSVDSQSALSSNKIRNSIGLRPIPSPPSMVVSSSSMTPSTLSSTTAAQTTTTTTSIATTPAEATITTTTTSFDQNENDAVTGLLILSDQKVQKSKKIDRDSCVAVTTTAMPVPSQIHRNAPKRSLPAILDNGQLHQFSNKIFYDRTLDADPRLLLAQKQPLNSPPQSQNLISMLHSTQQQQQQQRHSNATSVIMTTAQVDKDSDIRRKRSRIDIPESVQIPPTQHSFHSISSLIEPTSNQVIQQNSLNNENQTLASSRLVSNQLNSNNTIILNKFQQYQMAAAAAAACGSTDVYRAMQQMATDSLHLLNNQSQPTPITEAPSDLQSFNAMMMQKFYENFKTPNSSISIQPPIVDTHPSVNMIISQQSNPARIVVDTSITKPIVNNIKVSPVKVSHPDDNDQPIDLSMSSSKRSSFENSSQLKPPQPQQEQSKNSTSLLSLGNGQNYQQSNRSKFGLVEKKQLTQEIVRSFSPLAELNSIAITPPKSSIGRKDTNNLYKSIRTEEFALLSPGVHTPHRLPVNFRVNSESSSNAQSLSRVEVVAPVSNELSSSSSPPQNSSSSQNTDPFITSEEKAVCPVCSKTFIKQSQLSLHLNIHNFERPFRCESCGVSFQKKGHLQKHSRSTSHLNKLNMNNTFGKATNENPRPFKCIDCQIAFRIHGHLAKHLRSKIHIMKLECLGKLPFGMYAEMERLEIPLGPNSPIDTTDCKKALESLRKLAQQLYDPGQIIWKVSESNIDNLENYQDDDETLTDDDEVVDEDDDDCEENGKLIVDEDISSDSPQDSIANSSCIKEKDKLTPEQKSSIPATTLSGSSFSSVSNAMRSSTCDICSRTFKSAKFLQVHLYSEHPEEAN